MEWIRKIEIEGKEREIIIKKAEERIRQWDLKMPAVFFPLVLDFGLGDFSETGHIEYWIANNEQENYCGKLIFMFSGQTCPAHYHKKKHETFMVIKGSIVMHLKNKELNLNQGDVLPMSQETLHSFTATQDSLILEVSLPSEKGDNFFKDDRIGII